MKGMNELAKQIHEDNVERGFYDEKREMGTLLMLIVSEVSEALEADRKGRHVNIHDIAELCNHILDGDYGKLVEVKEVDLEKEIQDHIRNCLDVKFPTTDIKQIKKDVEYTARMFFELGLKAQKGE